MLWKKGYSYKTKIRQQIGSFMLFSVIIYYNTSMLFTTCPCFQKYSKSQTKARNYCSHWNILNWMIKHHHHPLPIMPTKSNLKVYFVFTVSFLFVHSSLFNLPLNMVVVTFSYTCINWGNQVGCFHVNNKINEHLFPNMNMNLKSLIPGLLTL